MLLEGGRSLSLEDAFILQSTLLDLSAAILQHLGMSVVWKRSIPRNGEGKKCIFFCLYLDYVNENKNIRCSKIAYQPEI